MCDVVPDSDGCLRNYSLYAVLTSQEDIVGALAMTFHRSKPFHQSQMLAPKHNRARVLFLFFFPPTHHFPVVFNVLLMRKPT